MCFLNTIDWSLQQPMPSELACFAGFHDACDQTLPPNPIFPASYDDSLNRYLAHQGNNSGYKERQQGSSSINKFCELSQFIRANDTINLIDCQLKLARVLRIHHWAWRYRQIDL